MRRAGRRRWAVGCGAVLAVAVVVALLAPWWAGGWPAATSSARLEEVSSEVVDRDGALLRAFPTASGHWRLAVRPDQVDPGYLALLKLTEDRRFDGHAGIDPLALGRAIGQAVANGRVVSGASTLSMQAARLLEPRPRTLAAKLREASLALRLERERGKDGVLAIWLTLAPFGGNLEGVRAASLAWFGKEPTSLAPAEAALLVALPRAPERLRPDRHATAARAARDRVLRRAAGHGLLSGDALAEALATPVPERRLELPMVAAHLAARLRQTSPGVVRTTIDGGLQRRAEAALRQHLRELGPEVTAAAMIVELPSMAVLASVGSPGLLDRRRRGALDLTRAVRSPGSTLKPVVYGLAFDRLAIHPDTLLPDRPTRWGDYQPVNLSGAYTGTVTAREALRRSLNLPAVALLDQLGAAPVDAALRAAGVTLAFERDRAPASLPLVLGGVGASLADMLRLYAAIGGDGRVRPLRETVIDPASPGRPLLSAAAAWQLRDVLRGPPDALTGARPNLGIKTGTSFGQRDAWAMGVAPGLALGVWVGRADGTPCAECRGAVAAVPLLRRLQALTPERPWRDPRPAAALAGPNAALPPALRRLELGQPAAAVGPRIVHPLQGTGLPFTGDPVPLRVQGGRAPYRWLVNGRPLPAGRRGDAAAWPAEGLGWARATVVDAAGRSATTTFRVVEAAR